jgi:DNA-binding NarL/FixJ family response regulator
VSISLFLIPAGVILVLAAWSWALHLRQQARIEALEGRVANLLAGLSLLTDTTEGALRDVTAEVTRLSTGGGPRASRPRTTTTRRVGGAARRGRTVQEIAAAEQLSEGEVKLHLSLTETQGGIRAEMR